MTLDAQQNAEMDQNITTVAEMYPRLWWALFDKLKEQGFTEGQAIELVKEYIRTTLTPQ